MFNQSNKRRAFNHDYYAPYSYLITLNKRSDASFFSKITGTLDNLVVELSPLGKIIREEIFALPKFHPIIRVEQYIIMPDHVHMLVRVMERSPKHLGYYIGNLTGAVNRRQPAFEPGYNDKFIHPGRSLDDVYQYIRQNPYRLAVRQQHPEFFRKSRNLTIGNQSVQGYGNLFLLRNPFKYNLVIHRSDTDNDYRQKLEHCKYLAENGGVIVSPFISPREKQIRKEVEELRGRIIVVHDRVFTEREKPARHDFNLCCNGQLLLIAPTTIDRHEHPTRSQCIAMNNLASIIASTPV